MVVAFCADVVVREVLFPMESNLLRLHLSILDVDLVADEDDRNIVADADEISVPVRDVLVGDSGCDVKHDDGAFSLDVVTISKASELLLTGGIPDIEFNDPVIRVEIERVDLHSQSSDVFLLELSRQMALYESCLSDTSIADQDHLKLWNLRRRRLRRRNSEHLPY